MHRSVLSRAVIVSSWCAALLFGATVTTARAHEGRESGTVHVVVGWAAEPPVAGVLNAVQLTARHKDGDPAQRVLLRVSLGFGSQSEENPRALLPGRRAEYRAAVVPTRAGAYVFHVTGKIEGRAFDQVFTSGPSTFEDVISSSDLEFPVKDPSRGELAQRLIALERQLDQARAGTPEIASAARRREWYFVAFTAVLALMLVLFVTGRIPSRARKET